MSTKPIPARIYSVAADLIELHYRIQAVRERLACLQQDGLSNDAVVHQKARVLNTFHATLSTGCPSIPTGAVRIVCISDTHNYHRKIPIAELCKQLGTDDHGRSCPLILLHAGDFTDYGTWEEISDFCDWLDDLKPLFQHIVVVPGNHDLTVDGPFYHKHWTHWWHCNGDFKWMDARDCRCGMHTQQRQRSAGNSGSRCNYNCDFHQCLCCNPHDARGNRWHTWRVDSDRVRLRLQRSCTLLAAGLADLPVMVSQFAGTFTDAVLRVFGAAAQPRQPKTRRPMAYGYARGTPPAKAAWRRVPASADVVVTHTPAHGILDGAAEGGPARAGYQPHAHVGCEVRRARRLGYVSDSLQSLSLKRINISQCMSCEITYK
eukprot:m.750064 g.750064  ORF g.750064 m.750064 type:complete len:375 (+) comp23156_c0_seq14:263-1387(+)